MQTPVSPSRQVRQTAASHIEGNRDEIPGVEVFDVAADLYDLAGDLVTQHHANGRRSSPANHVLVGTTNIRGNDLQYDSVLDLFSCRIAEGGKIDALKLDLAGSKINDTTIVGHPSFLWQIFALRRG
jgi:hypothetical protein